ncbi:MAG: CbiX/SirB N-terminal domain-containing protein, partial [Desulfobacterales bacterium]
MKISKYPVSDGWRNKGRQGKIFPCFLLLILLCLFAFTGCSDDDDDDNNQESITENVQESVATDTLNIVRDGAATTYTYEQGETTFSEVSATGTVEQCLCQRLAFRSAQALQASKSFQSYYPDGIPVNDIRIVTKWSTDGAEELFVDIMGWDPDNMRIHVNAADPNSLTLADTVFYFVSADGENAWKVSANAALFPENFFALRTTAKNGGSEADKAAFKSAKTDAMENYLRPLPLENRFTVEKISAAAEGLTESLAVIPETVGVLVIAHGSDEAQWNADVINAVEKVNLPYPVALGFLEYHAQDIAYAVSALEEQGVNRIIAVPLFISTYSNHIEEIRYVLGLRDTLPETDAESAHPGSVSGEEPELVPVQTDAEIVLTSALDDHPAVAAVLAEHLATLSQAPENEIAVLAGHGWDAPEYKEKWDEIFTSLAGQVRTIMGLKDARHAFVAMGDPPLAATVSAAMSEGDVLIVPVMLSEGYFTQTLIPRL